MTKKRAWMTYPDSYFSKQVETLAGWIKTGESGSVVGLTGSGKSNFLGFLCHKPEVLLSHLPDKTLKLALVGVDLNDLPDSNLATFYRLILRSLFEARAQLAALEPSLALTIENLFKENVDKVDAFLTQSILREVLLLMQSENVRLVLVLDPFDQFCLTAPVELLDNLRGLRNSFKTTLSYVIGIRHPLAYLRDPLEIGRIYELLDTHTCWVGAMTEADARWVTDQVSESAGRPFSEAEIQQIIEVTGSYPSLLKAVSTWLVRVSPVPDFDKWTDILAADRGIQFRLEAIWSGLSEPEKRVLAEVQKWQDRVSARLAAHKDEDKQTLDQILQRLAEPHQEDLDQLTAKGLCRRVETGWRIASPLMARFVASIEGWDTRNIWLDDESDILYKGQSPLQGLTPLEGSVLSFLVKHPKTRHTKTDLIINTWPDDLRRQGVTDQSLYQVILEIRKKIEPDFTKPNHLITWRGKPEGGYQFFPEGKPG